MTYQPDVNDLTDLAVVAEKTKIPFWCFTVGLGVRPAIHYPTTDLEWLTYNLLYMGGVKSPGSNSEEYYALQKQHTNLVLEWVENTKMISEVNLLGNHTQCFTHSARDAVAKTMMWMHDQDNYARHKKDMLALNTEREKSLKGVTTAEDLYAIVLGAPPVPGPNFDTITERAANLLAQTSTELSMLQWLYNHCLMNWIDVRFTIAKRLYVLSRTNQLEE